MTYGSLCALGGLTPYPVLSALNHFPEDFVKPKSARASGLRALIRRLRHAFHCRTRSTAPRSATSAKLVTLTIDGREVTVPEGTSVMRAAALSEVKIPKLCATEQLEAFGSCRLCLVQIEGMKGLPASCTTPVAQGMKVHTQNKQLADIRRGVMELYISDHPLDCLTCPANGHCELQDMAGVVGLARSALRLRGRESPRRAEGRVATPISPSMPASASSARAACAPAMSSKARLALTIQGRGFDSTVSASQDESFMDSECVSCGACVQACPTATLSEKIADREGPGRTQHHHDLRLLRRRLLVPRRDAGRGSGAHGAEQGRPRQSRPFLRQGPLRHRLRDAPGSHPQADDPRARSPIPGARCRGRRRSATRPRELKRIQAKYGRDSIGGITSSRCTNEETYLVQKLVRAGFGNNNVDTCARVCHSPTGYGLKNTIGESAGTQNFDSVMKADVIFVIGANPTDGHPVFASQMKRRLRQGAKLIVADPRRIDLVRTPHIEAEHHLKLRPGTNVALINSLAHVIVTEGLVKEDFVRERCEVDSFEKWRNFVALAKQLPGGDGGGHRRAGRRRARRGAAVRHRRQRRHLLRPRRHRAQPGLDHGHGHRQPRHGHRQHRPRRRGRQSAARPEQRAGLLRHGLLPARVPGLPARVGRHGARTSSRAPGASRLQNEPGLRIPNMFEAALDGEFKGLYIEGEDIAQSDPNTQHVTAALDLDGMHHRAGPVPERVGEVRARVPAGLLVPGEGRHLHQRRAAHLARAQGDAARSPATRTGRSPSCCPMRSATR